MKSALFLSILSILFIYSCNNDSIINQNQPATVDTSTFTYPLTTGSTWSYQRIYTVSDFRPDSIRHLFNPNPIVGTGTITILGDTTINGVNARISFDQYQDVTGSSVQRLYYVNSDSALLLIAYRSSTTINEKPKNSAYFISNGVSAKNLINLVSGRPFSNNQSDTLIIENPPDTVLKYPVIKNKQWIYKYFLGDTISLKYLGFELIGISNQNVSAMKREFKWAILDNAYIYDYYSKFGWVKSDQFLDDIVVTDEFSNILGYVDIREVKTVTSYNIAVP